MPSAVSAPKSSKPLERSFSNPVPRQRRVVKRRGRVNGEFGSDDEIEREVRTDSESDDDHSSVDSDSESESSSSELRADAHSEVVTPSTTQSPPPTEHVAPKDPSGSHTGIFADATNWAEMVAGEAENGAADLPVIDFADMDHNRIEPRAPSPTPRSRKSQKAAKKAANRATSVPSPPAPAVNEPYPVAADDVDSGDAVPSGSHASPRSPFPPRGRGQTARQAYQQRLETDPSFVPRVGEFWGHDHRLLDKNLRSMSGWWRGLRESRGRGRGGFGMRGRGRGFYPGPASINQGDGAPQEEQDVPPVERPWTHDGFEEMKRRDERRRTLQEQHSQQPPHPAPQRGFGFRGRGFVSARGRGGFARGGGVSPGTSQQPLSSAVSMGDRVWYAQKPDKMWTKQHDIFLYSDAATKPRPGVGPGVRVKLPGGRAPHIVRLPPRPNARISDQSEEPPKATTDADKTITVRIPAAGGKEKAPEPLSAMSVARKELATTVEELSIEEVFTVRPNVVPNRRIDLSLPVDGADLLTAPTIPVAAPPSIPEESRNPIETLTTLPAADERSLPSAQIQETILRNPLPADEQPVSYSADPSQEAPLVPPALPPLQTSFSPAPPPTSPPYGSPYAYAPALPPGVGFNHQGMPYEYATGRPVYIQPTPPPMYTPRPMMHGHHPSHSIPFVPAHLRHHSGASPDFHAHPHTPQTPPISSFVDPATGVPIFSPARQTSRVEIRAPADGAESKRPAWPIHQRSNLSTSVAIAAAEVAQPLEGQSRPSENAEQQRPPQPPSQHRPTPSMEGPVAYAPYPQPYYYPPEQYGYNPYVDMSQPVMHYDMYAPEQHPGPPPPPPPHHQHHPSQPMVFY
ncbi:uncharacterized protein BXZ73DRAFT_40337 [Epithele typhae]|uniref:uncharacterized protein n=1 Tax=Epithele typhae TaxID=378194 RepID=UPI002008CD26|nr:uncharacterized protein BXZ73DRAFT_40337 [Epithele typhae]KAH9943210.1 hypothetical protein BXZ73DRAFT_40337 [Epithele typhae]